MFSNKSRGGFAALPLLIIVAILLAVAGAYYYVRSSNAEPQLPAPTETGGEPSPTSTLTVAPVSEPVPVSSVSLSTYSNFGISFRYPAAWGTPRETFNGDGLNSLWFGDASAQPLSLFVSQNRDASGTQVLDETLDQMVARFRMNDEYIYEVKDIAVGNLQGKELFFNNAVTGQPYHVEAIFLLRDSRYISLGADYAVAAAGMFDSTVASLELDEDAGVPRRDSATGMNVYSGNGIRFEYPDEGFATGYASFSIVTSVGEAGANTSVDDCYGTANDFPNRVSTSTLDVGGEKVCLASGSDVGAGQAYHVYRYSALRQGSVRTIEYTVHTSNGCGILKNSEDLEAPDNASYRDCLDFQANYDELVEKPIQASIATLTFTD